MIALCIILLFSLSIHSEDAYWPTVFQIPLSYTHKEVDGLIIESQQNLKENTYLTKNSITFLTNDSIIKFNQKIKYELNNDHALLFQDHYFDMTGSVLKKRFPFPFSSLGFEWMPTTVLNRNNHSSGIGSIRIGPLIELSYLDMPIQLGCGGAIDLWNNDLGKNVGWHDIDSTKGDGGFYGSIKIGDNQKTIIQGIPFFSEGSIFGQYMQSEKKSKFTSGEINALFFTDLAFADTFYLYCADTLSKGRAALKYTSTPNRTDNSIHASIGLKNIGDFYLQPSISYTLANSSITYPSNENILGDEQLIKNTIAAIVEKDSSKVFNYSGGISFTFEKEDWLFRNQFSDTAISGSKQIDSLTTNLQDYNGFLAQMYHIFEKKFNKNLGFMYSIGINRYKKVYPNTYYVKPKPDNSFRTRILEVRENSDKDNVTIKHSIDLLFLSNPFALLTAFGEYSRNESVFLRKEKSFLNKTLRVFRIESIFHAKPEDPTNIKEVLGAIAKVENYHFPTFDTVNFPTHSRKFYSKLTGVWALRNFITLEGSWDEVYLDEGYRYPYWKYKKGSGGDELEDAYGPYFISLESSIKLSMFFSLGSTISIQTGSLFRYTKYYDWTSGTGQYKKRKNYNMQPFFEMNAFLVERAKILCKIQRYIDSDIPNYWEANSSISYRF